LPKSFLFCSNSQKISFFSSTYQFNTTDDKTWRFMEASPHNRDMFSKLTPTSYTLCIFIAHAAGAVLTVKYVLAETYDFYFYFVIISLYTRVRDSASGAVSSGCPLKIEKWLEEHQECCRYIIHLRNCGSIPAYISKKI
jgi:hypothetical protein